MLSFGRPGREELAAALLALALVVAGAFWWNGYGNPPLSSSAGGARLALSAALPLDPKTRSGTLANGVRYFVRNNTMPAGRVELRLVVNAGSVLETDSQRGLAHAVEHMLFRGTKHFPRRAFVQYLHSIGLRDGQDINGRTTTDETVYRLTVPTDRPGVLDTAMAILADMAHDASFDPAEARIEAGIVFEEWRTRGDATERLTAQRNAQLLDGSPYASRPPIGDTAVLRRFDVTQMRQFYDEWYRPELMAVVAVGDAPRDELECLLKKHFDPIPASATRKARREVPGPARHALRALTLVDSEATSTRVAIWYPLQIKPRRLVADYRQGLIAQLWQAVLEARLDDAAERAGSPLLNTDDEFVQLARPVNAEHVSAAVLDTNVLAGLDLLAGEVARLARYGPTAREMREQTGALLRRRQRSSEFADESSDLAEALVAEFTDGHTPINRASAAALARDVLPTIRLSDVLEYGSRTSLDSGATILVTGPAHARNADRAPAVLVARSRAAATQAMQRWSAVADSVVLMDRPPERGHIATERTLADVHAFEWTLANGMHVILKPTAFAYDQIQFRLFGPGGSSLADSAEYASAYYSDNVIASTGIGRVNGLQLSRMLDASSIDVSRSIDDSAIEFSGSTATADLELLFQVLYLHFTAPRGDTAAFRRFRERLAASSARRSSDPDAIFSEAVAATIAPHHPRSLESGARLASEVDLAKALRFWKARMANAANFTLVMTGDFTLDRLRPLVERYLASLTAGVREVPRDMGVRFPAKPVRRDLHVGIAPRARTQLVLSGPLDSTLEAHKALQATRDVVEGALENRLREALGGTYGVEVTAQVDLLPPMTYRMWISFEASPERIDSLANAAIAELNRLRVAGPTTEELERLRATESRDLDHRMEDNDYWAAELGWHSRMGWSLGSVLSHQQSARTYSADALRAACTRYLSTRQYVRVTMYPATAKPASPMPSDRIAP